MTTNDDFLSTLNRHVEEAQRMVSEQKGRVMRLRAAGNDTFLAETTLSALEANLKRFQQHKDWVERRADTQKETATAAQNVITAT